MNFEDILRMVQDARSALAGLGVNNQGLIVAAVVAGLLFLLSLREVMTWYLRVYLIRDELKALRAEIAELKSALREQDTEMDDVAAEIEDEAAVKLSTVGSSRFRLNH